MWQLIIEMSSIDQYSCTCIGIIECPTPYRLFVKQDNVRPIHIAIYHLEQDIPEAEIDFQGKAGDIVVGGGGGEAPAMRIQIPEAIVLFTEIDDAENDIDIDLIPYQIYWRPTESYILGAGFKKLRWNPEEQQIEVWLTEHVLAFLLKIT